MVGVEQDELDLADRHQPDPDGDVTIGDRHVDGSRRLDGAELGGFVALVAFDLVAVGDVLAEEALAVEQPDADERDGEVVRRLDVIAGEDAETARVLGHELGDPELWREVGDLRPGPVVGARGRRANRCRAGRRRWRRRRRAMRRDDRRRGRRRWRPDAPGCRSGRRTAHGARTSTSRCGSWRGFRERREASCGPKGCSDERPASMAWGSGRVVRQR